MARISLVGPDGESLSLLVDDEDYGLVKQFKWSVKKDGEGRYYAHTTLSVHEMVTGFAITDHINGDGLDNRQDNLRSVTAQQNSMNRRVRSDSKTGFKGVSSKRGGKGYIARIVVDGKRKLLGWFHDPIDAAHAYDAAAREHYGEYARCNFPSGR